MMAVQELAFPDIEGVDFVRDEQIEAVGRDVLASVNAVRSLAQAVSEGEVTILWLRNDKPFDPDKDKIEHGVAGKCVKAPAIWHDVTGVDIAIWLRGYFWDRWTPKEREAFVLHELLHVHLTWDKDNNVKVGVQKHDVEDFVEVVHLYGPVVGDSARYVRAALVGPVE